MKRPLIPLILVSASVVIPGPIRAQSDPPEPTVIVLHPAGEPTPALKYTLLPEPRELLPGNAAIFYHRALHLLLETQMAQERQARSEGRDQPERTEANIIDWIDRPLGEIPVDEAREQLDLYGRVLREVELGALREDCDWEFDRRPESIDLLLPEVQSSRSLARLVSLRVRLAILDGDVDAAVHWLRTGYALARHVSDGPSLIQSLVGLAIGGVMNGDLIELIQLEGTPSLYWAIAHLPDPVVDMSAGLVGERSLVDRLIPELRELEGPPWSVEQARRFVEDLGRSLSGLSGQAEFDRWTTGLGLTALFARAYPDAKRSLIEGGMPEAEVEAMPVAQVVGLVSYRRNRELSDDLYKWMDIPYPQAYRPIQETYEGFTVEQKLSDPGVVLFEMLRPYLLGVKMAEVRADRQLAALRCVEAIRLFAASHDGQLPPSLDAIAEVPLPLDPATGEPFSYAVDGDTATLSAPLIPGGPDHPAYRIDYQLRLAD
ncbi:hypothetical protein [Tautonia plasticadhaerens]|uniref:Uncharacterized protein n=1 Tax=Tautonia plasticadhaerens TaxID=2527974 RepID=A0A518HC30_9BACT|nr:hypothetical protein [Tautonia plasticadhaerens]QDV38405.1 hypothetical protein ElP_63600 [Tautonia plasticadhaerens]